LQTLCYLAEIQVIVCVGEDRFQPVEIFGDVINKPNFGQRKFDIATNRSQPPATLPERRLSAS
jgi:hypothetical protein